MIVPRKVNDFLLAAVASVAILAAPVVAQAAAFGAVGHRSVTTTLLGWLPLILLGPQGEFGGFVLNIAVSVLAMGIGTVLGLLLGMSQTSLNRIVRISAWSITQFFRNSPWLVLLFFVILLLPFNARSEERRVGKECW